MVGGLESWFTKWAFVECDFNMGQIGLENMFGTGALVQFDEGVE